MGNENIKRVIVALFCAVVMVYGSIAMSQCSAAHPITLDSVTGRTISSW